VTPHLGLRRDFIAALTVVVAVVLIVAGKFVVERLMPRPSPAQCAALLDRYLEHASRAADPAVDEGDIEATRTRAETDASRYRDLSACERELTRAEVECGLASPNVDEMERCLQ
jgi:hypothetical protein